jgi:hypothetical protein
MRFVRSAPECIWAKVYWDKKRLIDFSFSSDYDSAISFMVFAPIAAQPLADLRKLPDMNRSPGVVGPEISDPLPSDSTGYTSRES